MALVCEIAFRGTPESPPSSSTGSCPKGVFCLCFSTHSEPEILMSWCWNFPRCRASRMGSARPEMGKYLSVSFPVGRGGARSPSRQLAKEPPIGSARGGRRPSHYLRRVL
eukprot:CAMPEP_0195088802 /NCGR_PEP_ID=MMETSP0448-20130528/28269_1 /TAXON_ID=66468 /ORGANISM="Heterocapsa triquestra, Strain CCMP 448" /LENGTH=109 /DNA_ID=CAMNT_0040122491 /DNA_START=541 /DNA_END=867 /DNA_ORIENTATION=-